MWPFHLLKLPLATFIKQDRRKRQDDMFSLSHFIPFKIQNLMKTFKKTIDPNTCTCICPPNSTCLGNFFF
jgi:hypothetical protein